MHIVIAGGVAVFRYSLIIGSDRRPESKQGKIVRFRSCLYHSFRSVVYAAILSIWRKFKSRYTETRSDVMWRLYTNAQVSFRCVFVFGLQVCSFGAAVVTYDS